MIAIIDYGMGNLHSVAKALEGLGGKARLVTSPKQLARCSKIVLPGVGAFADAVTELKKRRLFFALKEEIARKKIFLGICLGMQLLFEGSQEAPGQKGLALLGGSVKKFQASRRLKVPQMGWNQLDIRKSACPLLRGVSEGDYVYFCHSYYPEPKDKSQAAATTRYGTDFASVIWKDNLFAVQFHPEKSQAVGLKILKNFVKL